MKPITLKAEQIIELTKLTQWLLLSSSLMLCLFSIKLTWWFSILLPPIAIQMLINQNKINQQLSYQLILNSEQSFLLLNNGTAQAQKLSNYWQTPQFIILALSNNQQKNRLLIKKSALTAEQFTAISLAVSTKKSSEKA